MFDAFCRRCGYPARDLRAYVQECWCKSCYVNHVALTQEDWYWGDPIDAPDWEDLPEWS